MSFETHFIAIAEMIAMGIEFAVVIVLALAVIWAIVGAARAVLAGSDQLILMRETLQRLGISIVLALELALAADIVRTAIAPDWDSIGRLAAIAAIRTALNWFLLRDLRESGERARRDGTAEGRSAERLE
jgi:uncharacterized membrane protein